MKIRVLLFAALREAVGEKELDLEVASGASLRDLLATLEAAHPPVQAYRGRILVSLNRARRPLETTLGDGDEVALLPPVSGGSGGVRIQSEPLSLQELLLEVVDPVHGGVVTFTGVVREVSRGREIDHLEYEAYEPMAKGEMEAIRGEAERRWPDVRLAIAHRVGRLEIGDTAVAIVAASPHRADAFEACRFAIDELKRTVPIWKKEFARDGAYWVEENP